MLARRTVAENRIIAVGLLTRRDLDRLGSNLARVWPVEEAPGFEELLEAIDQADRQLQANQQMPKPE